jgi:hypothetical protein
MGVAELHQAGTLGVFDDAAFKRDGAQFVGCTAAWPHFPSPQKKINAGALFRSSSYVSATSETNFEK